MIITRTFARANHWTFQIPPIAKLLSRYIGDGKGWIDPYSGTSNLAEFTNDLNAQMPSKYHMEAVDFCKLLEEKFKGVLIDPPYSYRQITEHYRSLNMKATALDTSYNFYHRVFEVVSDKIEVDGFAITCGWNSNGIGKVRGFEIIEILLVAHGLHHNDTIVTVERKLR